ncbi:mitochondrial 54S ribosomal protein YmL35 [Paracoccidioides lutzii Pb01]|uniref:Large ribosomal subunit protein mL38 n=1 Tax=Paracoccidioides lutzii (strain ATCC MYA-826 / Pb01) TaxID=502779 RepID=C1GV79_PARBA|nr:mitochondrial 54S ribosomal protein YmL35 [Paracoccidioides lutzii Pb01]EEH40497.1 hypothetical protein PAAG_02552 [Paracoccidioides lutzii Pb01]
MTHCELASRPLFQCLRHTYKNTFPAVQLPFSRSFSSTPADKEEAQTETGPSQPFYRAPDPALVTSPQLERRLLRAGNPPIGSRRRRAALQDSPNIPFELLPYQCFQEARKVLLEDREEKIKQIETESGRIARLRAADPATVGGELQKNNRLRSMEKHLEYLKIQADINDPVIKKRFEDGLGDMNLPIYRFLADKKWREYRRKIIVQRITQMKVVPDVLPHLDPIVDVKLAFGRRVIPPGEFVDSRVSSIPAKLNVQSFERGEKLLTIAVVDSDVPDLEHDTFGFRCHFLAINVPISPNEPRISLDKLSTDNQVIFTWFPPYAQKGSPYHRLSVVVLEQKDQAALDLKKVAEKVQREDFCLRSILTRHQLKPIGAHLFRSKWDENTESVMNEFGIPGADIEFLRKRIEPLPYKRRNPSSFR